MGDCLSTQYYFENVLGQGKYTPEPDYEQRCKFCGGDLQKEFTPAGVCMGALFFPLGLILCCMLKKKRCIVCNDNFYIH